MMVQGPTTMPPSVKADVTGAHPERGQQGTQRCGRCSTCKLLRWVGGGGATVAPVLTLVQASGDHAAAATPGI